MKEFTAIIGGVENFYFAYCLDIPDAHGQGKTLEECSTSLAAAISSIMREEPNCAHGSIYAYEGSNLSFA